MGTRYEARIAHEKKIAKLEAELKPIEAGVVKEQALEADLGREIAKLALKAAQGDRAALKEQRKLREEKAEHNLQVENLEADAVTIRRALAVAQDELPHFALAEVHERVADGIKELPGMVAELSKVIQPIARAFGEFRARVHTATAAALPLIARGDPDRIRTLENRLRTMLIRGIRCQLSYEFRGEGLDIVDVSEFEGKDFQSVVEPVLRSMIAGLEVSLHANGLPTPGRANFRCATNISGLFGLSLRVGEIVSLPTSDENVRKMIGMGALEILDPPKTASEEEGTHESHSS
jgi:hypothetical protein